MSDSLMEASALNFLAGGGEMGARMRAKEWKQTPFGDPSEWPQSLRSILSVCLNSPMLGAVLWGPDFCLLYNDAYIPSLGDRHPNGLGLPARKVWGEVWEQVSAPFHEAIRTGKGFSDQTFRLEIERDGKTIESWWDLTSAPIRGEDGSVVGLFNQGVEITTQMNTTRALKAERERLEQMFDRAPSFMALLDGPDHRIVLANAAYHRLVGHREVLGKTVAQALPDAVEQGYLSLLDGVYASGQPYAADGARYAVQAVPGGLIDERVIDFVYQPVTDQHGAVTGVFLDGVDVTDRIAAQEATKASEAYLRLLLNSSAEAFYAVDREGVTTLCNAAFLRMMGFESEADALGRKLHDIIHHTHPDGSHYAVSDCPIYACARDGAAAHVLGESFYRTDGIGVPVEYWAKPILVDGEHRGAICTFLDVSDRIAADSALRKSERDLRVALTAGRFGSWSLDLSSFAFETSPVCRINFGRDPELAFAYSDLRAAVHPDDQERMQRAVETAIETRTDYDIEYRILTPAGEVRWVTVQGQTVYRTDGTPLSMAGVCGDVTDRKAMEQELYALNADLEQHVEDRTRDLLEAQEALRQAQKMEAVGQLTGGIAHDFNNLLQGITGSLEIIQRRISEGRSNDIDRFVTGATTAANRAAALTHRLLAFSRRQPLDPRPVKANPLVASLEDLFRRTLGEQIELELVLAGGLWTTLCDPNQLESALLNLVINARDAMPNGGHLTIETGNAHLDSAYASKRREVRPGQYVCLAVTDTGSGMSADTIAKAFEPFFTTKPIGQGTGLGLSMIYGFAQQSEGYAKIDSEVGKGTTFKLYLPRHLRDAEADEPLPQLGAQHVSDAGEVVLVVEDEPVVRGLIVEVLNDLGYRPIEASDGPKGLAILQSQQRVDLLVTDIGLPGLNGRQVAEAARLTRPELRVLFMTGYAENAALASGFLEHGMSMITKPFAMEALATRIRQMIES